MENRQYISVNLRLDDQGRALTVEAFYYKQPLNVLGVKSPLKAGEYIHISTDHIKDVDQNRCRPAPALVRHLSDHLADLREVLICDQGTMTMRFKNSLRHDQLDDIASMLTKHLCVMIPLSAMLALT